MQGKPIVMTAAFADEFPDTAVAQSIWDRFLVWKRDVEPTLREEDRMFVTDQGDEKVWVIGGMVGPFTILFPRDY